MNFLSQKLALFVGEGFVILACVVFTQCQRVTDGRTDGQTDGQTDKSIVANTGICIASMLTPCKNCASCSLRDFFGIVFFGRFLALFVIHLVVRFSTSKIKL